MGDKDKVRSRYPCASAEEEGPWLLKFWAVWHISHEERRRLDDKHWPQRFSRYLLGTGRTEDEAWANAEKYIHMRGY